MTAFLASLQPGLPAAVASDSRHGPVRERGLCCVADARIDNRSELAARFELAANLAPAALILALYRRLGTDCVALLEGDFAFVLWDAPRRRLVGARDRFGVKPLYFSDDRSGFVVANDIGRLPGRARRDISDQAASAFLAGVVPDDGATFFPAIKRLPPASTFERDDYAMTTRRYWQLDANGASFARPADQAERLRELLERSVEKRLAGTSAAGALLSGGLDSSSIARLVRDRSDRAVPTFSLMHSEPALSERRYLDAILCLGGFSPTIFDGAAGGPFADLPELLEELHEPVLAPNLAAMRPLFRSARHAGVDVLFDGHGGDEVVSHGFDLLPKLAREGNWGALWRALGAADTFGQKRTGLFLQYFASRQQGIARRVTRRLGLMLDQGGTPGRFAATDFISPDYARQTGILERVAEASSARRREFQSPADRHRARLCGPEQSYAFEVLDRVNRAAGLEGRYPFWDRRLVEYCAALPMETKLAQGWSRLILRQAMAPVLPGCVAWRRTKVDFSGAILRGMIHDRERTVERALAGSALQDYLDLPRLRAFWQETAARPDRVDGKAVQAIWRIAVFATWLDLRRTGCTSAPALPTESVQ